MREKDWCKKEEQRRTGSIDNELLTRRFEIENKLFFLDFKENSNGRYLKITERSGDKRSFVIVPARGLDSFVKKLSEIVRDANAV